MLELTHANVERLFMQCLPEQGASPDELLPVHGVQLKINFVPAAVAAHRAAIGELLGQLHPHFQAAVGGWSFLHMELRHDKSQWTDSQICADMLLCLALAIDAVHIMMEREDWNVLPGGVPYLVVKPAGQPAPAL